MQESYIVRIYRREVDEDKIRKNLHTGDVVGVVEDVQKGESAAFHNMYELWRIFTESSPDNPDEEN